MPSLGVYRLVLLAVGYGTQRCYALGNPLTMHCDTEGEARMSPPRKETSTAMARMLMAATMIVLMASVVRTAEDDLDFGK